MQKIPLQPVPKQKFNIALDGVSWMISLAAAGDCMYATIRANGVDIIAGARCMPNRRIIPYQYMDRLIGNFAFITSNDNLPWWENFGVDQYLISVTLTELETIRG